MAGVHRRLSIQLGLDNQLKKHLVRPSNYAGVSKQSLRNAVAVSADWRTWRLVDHPLQHPKQPLCDVDISFITSMVESNGKLIQQAPGLRRPYYGTPLVVIVCRDAWVLPRLNMIFCGHVPTSER